MRMTTVWNEQRERSSAVLLLDETAEKPAARRNPDDENVVKVSQKPLDRLTTARQLWARWVTGLFQRSRLLPTVPLVPQRGSAARVGLTGPGAVVEQARR
jgi:hypothetical protein